MSEASVELHIETLTDSSYVPSFTVKITAKDASGLTPCIFVHQYIPKLPCSDVSYEFINVAYYDELLSVADYIKDRKESCLVRLSSIEKRLPSREELDDFIATIQHDVQRLLTQINTTTGSGQCLDVQISASTITQTISDQCEHESSPIVESQTAPGIVTLTFDGSTIATL